MIVNSGNLIDNILKMGGMTKAMKRISNELIESLLYLNKLKLIVAKSNSLVNQYLNRNEKDFEILKIILKVIKSISETR